MRIANVLTAEGESSGSRRECLFLHAHRYCANTLSGEEREILCRKFNIAFFLAKEKLSFRKYPAICELEVYHGVNLGSAYKTEAAPKAFTHYIAESQRR